ncbi:MAG: hypothetical protein IJ546_07910 [Prevotella sp.]|nr:hypothetical protein [Prevotella sp.]
MSEDQILTQKARTELCCFSDHCVLRDHCLRRRLPHYLPTENRLISCMNPRYKDFDGDRCDMYVADQKVRMARGMLHLFDDMPARTAYLIRNALIEKYSRKIFYAYRKGDRLISPAMQQAIAVTMREHGWLNPPLFDDYVMDYCWT